MKTNTYTVTIEATAAPEKAVYADCKISVPYCPNEEFFPLAQRVRSGGICKDEDTNVMLLMGVRLLGHVLQQNTECPICAKFGEHYSAFVGDLKAALKEGTQKEGCPPCDTDKNPPCAC